MFEMLQGESVVRGQRIVRQMISPMDCLVVISSAPWEEALHLSASRTALETVECRLHGLLEAEMK
jgi:hypothetical protein